MPVKIILEQKSNHLAKSKLGEAIEYALGQWSALETYLKNGTVEIDNNRCEQGIRPIALGRKNWMHIGSHDSAPKITAIISILETCKRHQINTRDYPSLNLACQQATQNAVLGFRSAPFPKSGRSFVL